MKYCLTIILFYFYTTANYAPHLPQNQDLDNFILRLAHRYYLPLPQSFLSKPLPHDQVYLFLNQADSLNHLGILTAQESLHLRYLQRIYGKERSLFKWHKPEWDTENYLNLRLKGEISPFYDKYWDIFLKGTIEPGFSGAVGYLSYFSEVKIWTEYQSDTSFSMSSYQPFDGNPYNLYGRAKSSSIRSSDLFRGGIAFKKDRINFASAVDYIRQGPAIFYPLTFSGETSPLTYFRTRLNLGNLLYTHTFGLLRTQRDKAKYFYTHRLDFSLFKKKLKCGLSEVIINGSTAEKAQTDSLKTSYYGEKRSWEWVYMIPFIPYVFAEHYVGDRDNAILSFDISVAYPRNFRWYIECFLDDFSSPLTILSDDYGNKWAFTIGGQYFGTISRNDLTISLEYSRVEPWVYTHFYGGSHRYTHFGKSLGNSLGPNSDALILSCTYALNQYHSLGLLFHNIRYNRKARGGSITHVFQDDKSSNPDSTTKEFLGEDYDKHTTFGITWGLNPFGVFTINTEFTLNSNKKYKLEVYGGFSF